MADEEQDRAKRAEVAYNEVVRALDVQERTLESLRTRSAVFISAALVVAGVAANSIPISGRIGAWWVGVVSAAVAVAASILAGWPSELWLTNSGYTLVREFVDKRKPTEHSMYRDLAIYGQANRESNEKRIRRRRWSYTVSVLFLVVEGSAFALAARVP